MKKIRITKAESLVFDGTRVSNGHWAIALDACLNNFSFTEPYQFLIENKMQFKKDYEERPVIQSTLPNIDTVMQEGPIPAHITNVVLDGCRIVSWETNEGAGTVAFDPRYISLVQDLGSYFTLSDTHNGILAACDGEKVLAVVLPVRSTRDQKQSSLEPVWKALQLEVELKEES